MQEALAILYGILKQYQNAVGLSLDCKLLNLACKYAKKSDDESLCKVLWKNIAKYLLKDTKAFNLTVSDSLKILLSS